jgi:signal transduction histidine kinase
MKPGNYIFEVIAQDEFRNSSLHPARISFEVIPYFWMRYQFWIPVMFSLVVITAALVHWAQKYRHLLWNQTRLKEDIVTVSAHHQQKIARELHDSIMRDCTGISIVSKGLLNKLKGQESQYAAQVQMVFDCITNVSQQLRKIEKGLAPAGNAELGLIPSLRSFLIHIQSLFQIQCRCELDEHISFQNRQTETTLCQIAHEALFNAAKHANPKTIELLLKQENSHVLLIVRDDGCGMNSPNAPTGSGLQNMKHRADLIHAQLWIENLDTGGTQVTCKVPAEIRQP